MNYEFGCIGICTSYIILCLAARLTEVLLLSLLDQRERTTDVVMQQRHHLCLCRNLSSCFCPQILWCEAAQTPTCTSQDQRVSHPALQTFLIVKSYVSLPQKHASSAHTLVDTCAVNCLHHAISQTQVRSGIPLTTSLDALIWSTTYPCTQDYGTNTCGGTLKDTC